MSALTLQNISTANNENQLYLLHRTPANAPEGLGPQMDRMELPQASPIAVSIERVERDHHSKGGT